MCRSGVGLRSIAFRRETRRFARPSCSSIAGQARNHGTCRGRAAYPRNHPFSRGRGGSLVGFLAAFVEAICARDARRHRTARDGLGGAVHPRQARRRRRATEPGSQDASVVPPAQGMELSLRTTEAEDEDAARASLVYTCQRFSIAQLFVRLCATVGAHARAGALVVNLLRTELPTSAPPLPKVQARWAAERPAGTELKARALVGVCAPFAFELARLVLSDGHETDPSPLFPNALVAHAQRAICVCSGHRAASTTPLRAKQLRRQVTQTSSPTTSSCQGCTNGRKNACANSPCGRAEPVCCGRARARRVRATVFGLRQARSPRRR